MSSKYFSLDEFQLDPLLWGELPLNEDMLWALLEGDEESGSDSSSSSSSSSSTTIPPCHSGPGTLADYCIDAVDTRIADIAAEDVADAMPLFSTMDHENETYVRNTDCWLSDIADQLTCLSPWNSNRAQRKAGTLVSPRHLVMAKHYQYPVDTVVRFIDEDDQIVEREVSAKQSVGPTDITVVLLDSDVPSSINFAKVLPSNWTSYLSTPAGFCKLPAVGTNQFKKATVRDTMRFGDFTGPTDSQRALFYSNVIPGDSGHPAFLIINDELVLLTTWTGPGDNGPDYTSLASDINSVMTSLGGGYQLTTVDLSGFSTY